MQIEKWKPNETIKFYLERYNAISILISGMSRSGKSVLLKDIMTPHLKDFDFVIVFSKTLCNNFYHTWFEKENISTEFLYNEYNEEVVYKFKKIVEEYKNPSILKKLTGQKPKIIKTLFILDDCMSTSLKYENSIADLFMTSRHWAASIIIISQKMSFCSLSWQANACVIVSLFSGSYKEKKYISENIIADSVDACHEDAKNMSMQQVFREAYKIQTEIAQDYNAVIILPMEKSKIKQYKAKL